MKVDLVGYRSFISKKGTQCLMIGIAMEDPGWKGLRVKELFVNPDCVEGLLKPGNPMQVEFDYNGRIVSVKAE